MNSEGCADWLDFLLERGIQVENEAARTAQAIFELRPQWVTRLQEEKRAANLLRALDFLFGHPIVNARSVQEGLSTPYLDLFDPDERGDG